MHWPGSRSRLRLARIEANLDRLTGIAEDNRASLDALAVTARSDLKPTPGAPRHSVWLTLGVVACFGFAAWLTTVGAQAFSEPIAIPDGPGSIDVAVETGEPETAKYADSNDTQTWVEVITDEASDRTSISVWFPPESAGDRFLIVLKGTAQFEEFEEGGVGSEMEQCETLPGIYEECQLMYGRVPDTGSTSSAAEHACWPETGAADGPVLTLRGRTSAVHHANWAFNIVASPAMYGEPFAMRTGDYESVELPGVFAFARIDGCKIIQKSVARTAVETHPSQTSSTENHFVWWLKDLDSNTAVVTKDRRADTTGQIVLAIGAAIAGLGIGLVPVAFEAYRFNRARRRSMAEAHAD